MITRLLPLVLTAPLFAAELTIERGPFQIEHSFTASAIPAEPSLISLKPESWGEFVVQSILDHGVQVKKGDVLVAFEPEGYQRRVEDLKNEVAQKELDLASAEFDYSKLKDEVQLQLEAARRSKEQTEEDLKYFKEVGRPAADAELDERLRQYQFSLDAEKEELAQLKQMYEADDLTEATEEIILKRQLVAIESAEFDVASVKRTNEHTRTTTLPRRAESLERAAREANLAYEKADHNLPRSVKVAELKVQASKVALEREQLELERLKKDAALLEIQADTDGIFFHGSLEDGSWQLGDLSKVLVEGGKVPANRVIASVAPSGDPLPLSARVDPAVSRTLIDGTSVAIMIPGQEDLEIIGKLSNPQDQPGTDGKEPITIEVEWPEDLALEPAATVECLAVVYRKEDSISVPTKALQAKPDGSWSVELKMAEGEAEGRAVDRGRATKDRVEILDGLEAGQVIIVPD